MVSDVLILAGGAGTRLWPASVRKSPKQFMSLSGASIASADRAQPQESFMAMALERAIALEAEGEILVVTNHEQAALVATACTGLSSADKDRIVVLGEPAARNTAPAVALASAYLRSRTNPVAHSVFLMTSDHLILPVERFEKDARTASALADLGYLVCIGIPPQGPSTGYGYIETKGNLDGGRVVVSFREKPDLATARGFVQGGNYYWNSGMYAYGIDFMTRELETWAPGVPAAFALLTGNPSFQQVNGIRVLDSWAGLSEAYNAAPAISVDYAVSEHCLRVAMVPASFEWHDVGSFEEMAALFPDAGSAVAAPGSRGCWVYSDLPVVLCGVDDLMVVVKNGCVLVARRGAGQLVKDAVDEIRSSGRTGLL
ncbi:MAG: mannose-1-phosphate guanylyltransferase [Spirochaetota bacterium]